MHLEILLINCGKLTQNKKREHETNSLYVTKQFSLKCFSINNRDYYIGLVENLNRSLKLTQAPQVGKALT